MKAFLIFTCITLGSTVFGVSLAEKAKRKEAAAKIEEYLEDAQKECGTKVSFEFDWDTFAGWDWENKRVSDRCGGILRAMGYACNGSPEGKAAVATIKKISCFRRKDDAPELHTLKGGVLRYSIEQDRGNQNDQSWLKQALRDQGSVNLNDAEDWKTSLSTLTDKMKSLNSKCQTTIELDLDRKSFKSKYGEHPHSTLCDKPIDAVRERCEKEEWRDAARSKVKKIHCYGNKSLESSRFVSLKGGVLKFEVGKLYPNDWNGEQKWMDAALK